MSRLMPLAAALVLASCSPSASDAPAPVESSARTALTAGDREALRALDQNISKAWLRQGSQAQSEALLALFAPDAVIYPAGGREPLSGTSELRGFWFPEGHPPTEVEYFERRATAIEGSPALAAITGESAIAFTYDGTRTAQEGYYIIHARPDEAGHWKIERMMWSDRAVD